MLPLQLGVPADWWSRPMGLMSGHCTLNTISGRHPAGQPDQVPKMPDAVFGICSISALFQMKEHCVSCDCLSDLKMYNPSPPHYCSHRTELTFNLMCTCEHTWQPRQDWQKYHICLSHCVLLLRLRKQFPSLPIKKLSEHTVYTRLWTQQHYKPRVFICLFIHQGQGRRRLCHRKK